MKCKIGARPGNTCHPGIEANYEFKATLGCMARAYCKQQKGKKKTNNTGKVGNATDKPRKVSNTQSPKSICVFFP